jgi:hypothetical protein
VNTPKGKGIALKSLSADRFIGWCPSHLDPFVELNKEMISPWQTIDDSSRRWRIYTTSDWNESQPFFLNENDEIEAGPTKYPLQFALQRTGTIDFK